MSIRQSVDDFVQVWELKRTESVADVLDGMEMDTQAREALKEIVGDEVVISASAEQIERYRNSEFTKGMLGILGNLIAPLNLTDACKEYLTDARLQTWLYGAPATQQISYHVLALEPHKLRFGFFDADQARSVEQNLYNLHAGVLLAESDGGEAVKFQMRWAEQFEQLHGYSPSN